MSDQVLLLDLGVFAEGSGIIAGRDRGKAVREQVRLDTLDEKDVIVQVQIPDSLYSVNSSFFLGLFEKSIAKLGEVEFRRRYLFSGRDAEQVRDEGIRTALLMGAPFRPIRRRSA